MKRLRTAALAMTLVLTGGLLAACGGDDTTAASANAAEASNGDSNGDSASGQEGNEGRAFGSTDDAVITAVTTALKADRAEWDGSTLRVIFDEGSADAPAAWINCTAGVVVVADDENVVLVYPDGELDCSERPGY